MTSSDISVLDIVRDIWLRLGLPSVALDHVKIDENERGTTLPSSFRVGLFAHATLICSALSASLAHSQHTAQPIPKVSVSQQHAMLEFQAEKLYLLNGRGIQFDYEPVGGLHRTRNGYIRIHDLFAHHRAAVFKTLQLPANAKHADIAAKAIEWETLDLEQAGHANGAVLYGLRSFCEWDATPQGQAVPNFPIKITKLGTGTPFKSPLSPSSSSLRALGSLHVLDLSRVIAAPVAGKTLAAHGADVLWVTSPNLPDIPFLDCEFHRGKRTIQLDLNQPEDMQTLLRLIDDADVLLQSYRPGSLDARGLPPEKLIARNANLIIANVSAFPSANASPTGENPWHQNRGFDALVQTCTGLNVAEAEAARKMDAAAAPPTGIDRGGVATSSPARPLPCQALDHATGYLAATGICAALYRRSVEGGAFLVETSLAATAAYLRSLGQYDEKDAFQGENVGSYAQLEAFCGRNGLEFAEFIDQRETGLGPMQFIRHAAKLEGLHVGWDKMPKRLGSDEAAWLPRESV